MWKKTPLKLELKFHHVGIACEDLISMAASLAFLCVEGDLDSDVVFDPNLRAHLKLMTLSDGSHIELVSGEAVQAFIKRKQALYHICYEVNRFSDFRAIVKGKSWVPITKSVPAILFGGRLVQFYSTPMGLVEILES